MNIIKNLIENWEEKKLFRQMKEDTKNTISHKLGGLVYTQGLREFAKKCLVKGFILGVSFMGVIVLWWFLVRLIPIHWTFRMIILTVIISGLSVFYYFILKKSIDDEVDNCKI